MRVGVVGCGYWGSKHVRALSSLPLVSELVVIDERPDPRKSVGEAFPQALQRETLDDALDDVDAVVVATPPETHFEVAAKALTAGKHVLVEKPMATKTTDALRLVEMADAADLTLAAGHTFAYNAAVWALAEIAASGQLGHIHYIDAARLNLGLYRSDVNVLWDLAAHDISITVALLDDVPDTVSAWGTRHTDGFAEDVATLRMSFERAQVESTVRASWLDPVKVRRTTVVGSQQMVVYNDTEEDERIKIFDRARRRPLYSTTDDGEITYRSGQIVSPHIDFAEPLLVQATDFLECCATGRRPKADGRAGLTVVAVLEASDISLRENGAPVPVDLPPLVPSSAGRAR